MNGITLLQTGHIDLWILSAGLFFPRLTLFIACFVVGDYPTNTLPVVINFLGWVFFPRFLIASYIYVGAGPDLWFWAYIAVGIAGLFGESGYVRRRIVRRRTTVTRDGNTTTTVEEEEI